MRHYAVLAESATVAQLRHAVKFEPRPEPEPELKPEPQRSITKTADEEFTTWRIRLPHIEAATFDAGLQSHHDAQIAEWKRDHADGDGVSDQAPPMPNTVDAFMGLVEAGWDTDVARRPHGQHTTVVVHLDVDKHVAELHLGPLLTDAERDTCSVMPPARSGSNAPVRSSGCGTKHPDDQPPAAPRARAP